MPWCNTVHFGRIEYSPSSTFEFEDGLPGFEGENCFVLVQRPDQHPLVFVQSLRTPGLCLPALPVRVIEPNYQPHLSAADMDLLGFTDQPVLGCNALCLALIALHEDDPTANLLAPVVVNLVTRSAAQCIDPEMRYSHRHSLVQALAVAS